MVGSAGRERVKESGLLVSSHPAELVGLEVTNGRIDELVDENSDLQDAIPNPHCGGHWGNHSVRLSETERQFPRRRDAGHVLRT